MSATPKISTVIPTYNRVRFLGEALASVFAQTRQPDEIIVVDDGSTDGTDALVATYGEKVRYHRQANAGPAAARNRAIGMATGDFVAFLDSDDLWTENRLELQLAALKRDPTLDFLFGLEALFTAEKQCDPCEIRNPEVLARLNAVAGAVPDAFGLLLKEDFVPTSTVLFRRSCIEKVGLIDESFQLAEDYDFWLRFALEGCRFGFINTMLCRRRRHEGNLVNQWLNRNVALARVLVRYRDQISELRDGVDTRLSDLYYDMGSHLFWKRDFRGALEFLRQVRPTGALRCKCSVKIALARLLSKAASVEAARA